MILAILTNTTVFCIYFVVHLAPCWHDCYRRLGILLTSTLTIISAICHTLNLTEFTVVQDTVLLLNSSTILHIFYTSLVLSTPIDTHQNSTTKFSKWCTISTTIIVVIILVLFCFGPLCSVVVCFGLCHNAPGGRGSYLLGLGSFDRLVSLVNKS